MLQVIMPQLNLYASGTTKLDYLRTIDHLLDLHGQDDRIAIIIDESQVVSDEVLDELRLLSNRGQRNDRRLQLILVGQPELAEKLKKPELRQLNQRISSRGVLKPLTLRQALMYVDCMLSAQGGKAANLFEYNALERLLRVSDGIPRKINMLCHTAMLTAFHGGERKISLRTARKTAFEYQESVGLKKRRSIWRMASVAGATMAALIALALLHPLRRSSSLQSSGSSVGAIARTIQHLGHKPQHARPASPPQQAAAAPATSELAGPPAGVHSAVASATQVAPTEPETHDAAFGGVTSTTQRPGAFAEADRRNQIVVKYGDTLQKIAIRYFGSDSGVNQLIEANPQLTNIDQLGVGQVIYLPPGVSPKLRDHPGDQSSAASRPSGDDSPETTSQSAP
jgi:LysM repeat protein